MRRLLYVCLDGLADDPVPELGDRTPLEAARTPFLDSLARQGRTGVVTTVGEGIAPESDIAVFAILGYDPREEHPGRGVVEAIGSSMAFRDGDLAYREGGSCGGARETSWNEVAGCEPLEDTAEARRAAELTNAFVQGSHRILDASDVNAKRRAARKLPGNLVLTRDGGDHVPKLEPIK